jgi:rubrerythrin
MKRTKKSFRTGIALVPKEKQIVLLLDKLCERLAFEKTGIRLYEAMLTKVMTLKVPGQPSAEDLEMMRDEELDHFQLIHDMLKTFGGDPSAACAGASTTDVASSGILKVISDPRTTMSQSLSALLTAELTDHDGWQLLIQLAEGMGLEEPQMQFRQVLKTEEEHLQKVRSWLSQAVMLEAEAA